MRKAAAGILTALLVLAFTTTVGLAVIQLTGFPYAADIAYLDICEKTGLTRAEVMENYNAVIAYLSPFSDKEFSLPTLSFTDRAAAHFADVKRLFRACYILGAASAAALVMLAALKAIPKKTLRFSGAITLAAPAVAAAAAAADFDKAFTLFHSVFFESSSWVFDPEIDAFINLMPSRFFMHCSLLIAFFWLIGAAVQLALGYS